MTTLGVVTPATERPIAVVMSRHAASSVVPSIGAARIADERRDREAPRRRPAARVDLSRYFTYCPEMKTITVAQIRQNPTQMIDDVAAGEIYRITRHGVDVGVVVPPSAAPQIVPASRRGAIRLRGTEPHKLRSASSIEELLGEIKGDV